jgi:hypothetical protein
VPGHLLDPKARPEPAACREIGHEHDEGSAEAGLVLLAEPLPVAPGPAC